jgi:hypothetical protein
MISSARIVTTAALLVLTGCSVAAPSGADDEAEDLGLATEAEAQCGGYFVANVNAGGESVYYLTPQFLVDSSEGWGPQTLQIAIDRHFAPQFFFSAQPGVELQRDKVTKTLQNTAGYSITTDTELTASSAHEVLPGAYERLEAYPTFQSIAFDVYVAACGPFGARYVARGLCLKPRGVFFRVVTYVDPPHDAAATAPPPAPGMSVGLPHTGIGQVPVGDTPDPETPTGPTSSPDSGDSGDEAPDHHGGGAHGGAHGRH